MAECNVCFRHCKLSEGQTGFCGARECRGGRVIAANYGKITAIALDPIEKKPLNRFFPKSMILSVGSYGCNLRCPFCQNSDISWSARAFEYKSNAQTVTPEELLSLALKYQPQGNIGAAFTYNEPLTGYEFVRDTARLIHQAGMKNVLVTNGTAQLHVLEELAPYIDAMNIDLKGFDKHYYNKTLGGDMDMVLAFIRRAVQLCHTELTTLVVTGENDSEEQMREIVGFISSLTDERGNVIGKSIPLHISRFFPRFKMTDRAPTDVSLIYRLADIARERLDYVYVGNCP